jgi:predicted MFS family arabinose efflux permease
MQTPAARPVKPLPAVLAGLCSSLVGIGLARFAYTPLIPALIEAGWFAPGTVAYLGAANLAGYLAGALSARWIGARVPAPVILRAMMLLATATFFASATPVSFLWYFVWRFASGLAGGVLMVLAATTILQHISIARRGLAGGVIFTGVGMGIIASGTLIPFFLGLGLAETWLGLGTIALLLTAASWTGWPRDDIALPLSQPAEVLDALPRAPLALKALYAEYALCALGMVPHMVFLVDFVARGLGHGVDAGARYWVLFGIGAAIGPVAAGYLADRIGFAAAVRLAFLTEAVAVAMLAVWSVPVSLVVSSLIVGAFVPGTVSIVLGRVLELTATNGHARKAAWSTATTAFAVGQAVAAYGYSYVFAITGGGYRLLFALGAGAMVLALALDLAVAAGARRQPPATPGR